MSNETQNVTHPRLLIAICDLYGIDPAIAATMPHRVNVLTWLYRVLDTIDSKTSHLLRLNSLLLAAQSAMAAIVIQKEAFPAWGSGAIIAFAFLPLVAIGLALWVFDVNWPFLGWRKPDDPSAAVKDSLVLSEFDKLARLCDRRVKFHHYVWWLSFASAVVVGVSLVVILSTFV